MRSPVHRALAAVDSVDRPTAASYLTTATLAALPYMVATCRPRQRALLTLWAVGNLVVMRDLNRRALRRAHRRLFEQFSTTNWEANMADQVAS